MAWRQPATAGSAISTAKTLAVADDRAERIFVYAAWLVMALAALAYVLVWGRNLPYQDDWELIPVLTGDTPFSLSWLLEQTMEHRYVLGRALLYSIFRLGGSDFRAPMLCNVLLLAGVAFAALRIAWRVRGRASFSDAIFPLLLLHLGHYESLIFFVQLYFILPCSLLLILLLLIVSEAWQRRPGSIGTALIVAALPLCGGMGMLWTPPLAAWLLLAAHAHRGRRDGVSAWFAAAAIVAAVESLLVCLHLTFPENFGSFPRTPRAVTGTTLEVLSVAFGPPAAQVYGFGAMVALVATATSAALLWQGSRIAGSRLRSWGLVAVLTTGGLVALGIGWGRCILGPGSGAGSRYVLLTVPALCALYFAAVIYGRELFGRLAQIMMLCFACALLPLNTAGGLAYARARASVADAMLRDLRAGMPANVLAQRYVPAIYPFPNSVEPRLEMLRRAQAGPYRGIDPDAHRCHAVPLAFAPVEWHDVMADGEGWRALSDDPYFVFALDHAKWICGVQIDYTASHAGDGPVLGQAFWADNSHGDTFTESQRTGAWSAPAGKQSQTVEIYARIDHFRFDPDKQPGHLRIAAMSLLVEE
jgi:hypothetical protein